MVSVFFLSFRRLVPKNIFLTRTAQTNNNKADKMMTEIPSGFVANPVLASLGGVDGGGWIAENEIIIN